MVEIAKYFASSNPHHEILFDSLSGILSHIFSDSLSGISDILSGISSGTLSDILSDA